MSLPPGFVEELLSRVPLGRVVGRKVAWDPRKSNPARGDLWAPCPFHQEKTASFHVDDGKGYYYCFGCHAKGDAISFLRETEQLGFLEAVEALAAEAGMAMPARDPAAAERAAERQGLSDAIEAAIRFYRTQLAGARAVAARAYLDRRGLDPALRDRFEIGFAPDSRTALIDHLGPKFPRERLAEAGLIGIPADGGSPYDRFRGRIMFPIRDERGRAIAFGARAIAAGQEPKYLNSPETALFDKGRTLYNADRARAAAAKAGAVVVTEGYMDVIALAAAGIEHAVAPLGTAITEAQLERLWRLAPEPVVALDGDNPGLAAAQRLIDLALPLLGPGRSLRFALLPPGQDPDDVVRSGGPAAIAAVLAATRPIVDLLWSRETEGQVLDSPERRAALDARLKAHLGRIADPSLRGHWEREIRSRRAALFAPPPRPPRTDPPGAKGRRRPGVPAFPGAAVPTAAARASLLARASDPGVEARIREGAILAGCLNHPEVALSLEHRLESLACVAPRHAEIRDALLSALAQSLDEPHQVAARVAGRLGCDPLAELAPEHVRANRHLGPAATAENARRAIEEELTRHAALAGRAAEISEAVADVADADDALLVRVRRAAEAAEEANTRPLVDDATADESERNEFAAVMQAAEASRSRKPRKR